ncbi:hypothetical protein LXL04_006185 [Taraxacum kok-saghyz]
MTTSGAADDYRSGLHPPRPIFLRISKSKSKSKSSNDHWTIALSHFHLASPNRRQKPRKSDSIIDLDSKSNEGLQSNRGNVRNKFASPKEDSDEDEEDEKKTVKKIVKKLSLSSFSIEKLLKKAVT